MDILSTTGAGPWLVVAVVLAVLGLALAAAVLRFLLRHRPASEPAGAAEPAAGFPDDDLPAFLERPPGSAPRAAPSSAGWTALSLPPAPVVPAPPRPTGRWTAATVAAAVLAVLLLIAAVVCAGVAASRSRPVAGSRPEADRGAGIVSGNLSFGGVVLERHVVGVTATYPRVRLTRGVSGLVAHVELPTYNCLAGDAPADPVAAHCARSVPEYADLPAPALQVSSSADGRLRLTGQFPTYLRPNGGPAVRTGHVYRLLITAAPANGRPTTGEVPATGELSLGSDRAATTGVSVLRFGG